MLAPKTLPAPPRYATGQTGFILEQNILINNFPSTKNSIIRTYIKQLYQHIKIHRVNNISNFIFL